MQEKIMTILNTVKKKAAFTVMCGALVTAMGTGAAFAENNAGSMIKNDSGNFSYSTDDGETWQNGVPDGAKYSEDGRSREMLSGAYVELEEAKYREDGKFTIVNVSEGPVGVKIVCDSEGPLGIGTKLAVRNENGVIMYSTDDGETWSETAPEGFTVSIIDDNGGLMTNNEFADGELAISVTKSLLVKNEDGKISHSTDGGQTWLDGAPADAAFDADDKLFMTIGSEGTTGIGTKLAVKNENGVIMYSTDGGATWSDTTPEGMQIKGRINSQDIQ